MGRKTIWVDGTDACIDPLRAGHEYAIELRAAYAISYLSICFVSGKVGDLREELD